MKYREIQVKRDELFTKVSQAKEELKAAQKDLQEFDERYADAEISLKGNLSKMPDSAPVSAPTPAPESKVKATVTEAKPSKAKEKTSTVSSEEKKNSSPGRKAARGNRPPLRKAMVQVMGTKVLNKRSIIEALDEKGWLPKSKDINQYISYMLSSNTPTTFERTERRGYYRVRPGFKFDEDEATPKKVTKVKTAPKTDSEIDTSLIANYGSKIMSGNVEDNPFGDSV